jgi:hypothetical protein
MSPSRWLLQHPCDWINNIKQGVEAGGKNVLWPRTVVGKGGLAIGEGGLMGMEKRMGLRCLW